MCKPLEKSPLDLRGRCKLSAYEKGWRWLGCGGVPAAVVHVAGSAGVRTGASASRPGDARSLCGALTGSAGLHGSSRRHRAGACARSPRRTVGSVDFVRHADHPVLDAHHNRSPLPGCTRSPPARLSYLHDCGSAWRCRTGARPLGLDLRYLLPAPLRV